MKQKSLFFGFSLITSFCIANAQESSNTSYSSSSDDERTVFFGVDLGIGSNSHWGVTSEGTVLNVNIRILWDFCPYLGWNTFGMNYFTYADESNLQLLTGLRAYTPRFLGNMCFFASFKLGVGFLFLFEENYDTGSGFAYDFEAGFHFARTFFIAYSYNHQGGTIVSYKIREFEMNCGRDLFRIGFNF